jgi:hypothetical protein
MADYVTLSCPSCGGRLEISAEIDRFACGHCGNEHIVNRSGGIVSISPIVEEIKKVSSGVDATAAELAIIRIEKEIKELEGKKIIEGKMINYQDFFYGIGLLTLIIYITILLSTRFDFGTFIIFLLVIFIFFYAGWESKRNSVKVNEKTEQFNKSIELRIQELLDEKNQYISRIKNNK